MWSSFKNWFSTSKSSPPVHERQSTRRRFNKLVDYEVANRLKHGRHKSRRYDDSERRASEALRPLRFGHRSRRHERSRNDERIRHLKEELARLDRKYTIASESEGTTRELQRVVSKLEGRFNQARQELASALATKAARQAARAHASPEQISAAVSAALSTAGLAAPGLAAVAPATPHAMQYAALQAAALQAVQQNPNATGAAAAQIEVAVRAAEAAREKARQEGAERGVRNFEINAQNDAVVAANIASTKEHATNIGKGLYGLGGVVYNPIAAGVNATKGWFARLTQY
jgi:hypothetical protein